MRHVLPGALAAVALSLAAPAPAQQFLMTVEEGGEHFLALVDSGGTVLATTAPDPSPVGVGRFYRGDRWAALVDGEISLFDTRGSGAGTVLVAPYWSSMDVFPDGRFAVRDPWTTLYAYVYDAQGVEQSSWFSETCAGGPDFAVQVAPGDEVWLAELCGDVLRRYDDAGALLDEVAVPGGLSSLFDESGDDFLAAPDGSIWALQGDQPAVAANYDWTGAQLGAFPVVDNATGMALDADGTLWVRDHFGAAVLHYDSTGAVLGSFDLPPNWFVWSFDVLHATDVGQPYCGPANPNSTGAPGSLRTRRYGGSPWLELVATDLPPGEPGILLVSRQKGFVPFVGGGEGNLCLGGTIGRYAEVWSVPADGRVLRTVDLEAIPTPFGTVAAVPGETWHWQAWHRDHHPGPTSNLTDGLAVTIE